MTAVHLTPVRLTKTGRAGLKAVLDADQLDRHDSGLRAPGWNAAVDLPDDWTEPVPPPLPPEPPVGSFVACGADGNLLPFFRRWDEGWALVGDAIVSRGQSWGRVVAESHARAGRDPVLLVPAPEPDDDKPSAEDWAEGRKAARIHGYAGGSEVNSVSFAAGFAAGLRKGRRFPEPEPATQTPADAMLAEAESLLAEVPEPVAGGVANPASMARAQLAVLRAMLTTAHALLSAADNAEGDRHG